jgi:hypothetical protein
MPNRADFVAFLQSFQSAKFQTLRNAQAEVLENYNAYLARPDLGIELPTGAGKTLIALFISELWRRENKKVAILSANKTLARQMVSEAASLGVPSVLMEGPGRDIPGVDKRSYRRTSSIAVMVRILLSLYRDRWSLDDINVRTAAAESIRQRIPPTGWLIRVLDHQDRFVTSQRLLAEWP